MNSEKQFFSIPGLQDYKSDFKSAFVEALKKEGGGVGRGVGGKALYPKYSASYLFDGAVEFLDPEAPLTHFWMRSEVRDRKPVSNVANNIETPSQFVAIRFHMLSLLPAPWCAKSEMRHHGALLAKICCFIFMISEATCL